MNLFFIELFKNDKDIYFIRKYLSSQFTKRINDTKTQEYYYILLINSPINYIIGKYACTFGKRNANIELANYVLDNNMVNKDKLLIGVSAHGYLDVVKYLINLGANVSLISEAKS